MIAELRQEFNARFTPEHYRTFLHRLEQRCGTIVPFRNSETPCFFEAERLQQMVDAGRDLIGQLVANPDYLRAAAETVPPLYRVANPDAHPLFVQADFGLDENLQPQLVEIQGFPSLYAYQPTLAETYREAYALPAHLKAFLENLDADRYHALLRAAIVGPHDPENVVLLEIEPHTQKTLPDFMLTERLYGVRAVCITEVRAQGRRLVYTREGREIPIARIYNRVVVDELMRRKIEPGFDLRGDWEVEWAGHPDWYFLISKFSLPWLRHSSVPETRFLADITKLPQDLENYVLKPLFSFAGLGVRVGPTREEIEAVSDRTQYILQRRVNFVPVIETPFGPTKVEIRIMYVWPPTSESTRSPAGLQGLQAVTALLRMGRGKMMGVDQNRDMEWVGASAALTF